MWRKREAGAAVGGSYLPASNPPVPWPEVAELQWPLRGAPLPRGRVYKDDKRHQSLAATAALVEALAISCDNSCVL